MIEREIYFYKHTTGFYRVIHLDGRYPSRARHLGDVKRKGSFWDWETAPTEQRVVGYGQKTMAAAGKALCDALGIEVKAA